jgi:hypothetical protein
VISIIAVRVQSEEEARLQAAVAINFHATARNAGRFTTKGRKVAMFEDDGGMGFELPSDVNSG